MDNIFGGEEEEKVFVEHDGKMPNTCYKAQVNTGRYAVPVPNTTRRLKMIMLGPTFVGKTSLLQSQALAREHCKVQLWDTAGQERFRTLTTSFYRGAHGVCLCFDLTDEASFDKLDEWANQIDQYCYEHPIVTVVGCKLDLIDSNESLSRSVRAQRWAAERNFAYSETSAKGNVGVDDTMQLTVDRIMLRTVSLVVPADSCVLDVDREPTCFACYEPIDDIDALHCCCQTCGERKRYLCNECFPRSVQAYIDGEGRSRQPNAFRLASSASSSSSAASSSSSSLPPSQAPVRNDLPCPGCVQTLPARAKNALPRRVLANHEEMVLIAALARMPNLRQCANVACGARFEVAVPNNYSAAQQDDAKFLAPPSAICLSATCAECAHSMCFECMEPWQDAHRTRTCQQYADWLLENSACMERESRSWMSKNCRTCPGCGIVVFRDGGCSHMTHATCGTQFCFDCGSTDFRHTKSTPCSKVAMSNGRRVIRVPIRL
jgi:small GTP-binding protein